jgi:hypothetical protein
MAPWLQTVLTLLGGGVCATLIRVLYDRWAQRQQPIAYHVSVDSIFSSAPHVDALQATAQVTFGGQTFPFDELSLVRVDLKNKSNRDMASFLCGITLGGEHRAVLALCKGRDHHHQISEQGPPLTPIAPNAKVDVKCEPFNRGDEYSVRLYVRNVGELRVNHVTPSTPAPVRFVGMEDTASRNPTLLTKLAVSLTGLLACATIITVGFAALSAIDTGPTLPGLDKKQKALESDMEKYNKQLQDINEHLDRIDPAKPRNQPKAKP